MKNYPKTDAARKAQIKLVQSYRAIKYKEDVAETCGTLEKNYPRTRTSAKACQGVKPVMVADSTVKPAPAGGRSRRRRAESAGARCADLADAGADSGRARAGDHSSRG